jgi:hypothetical protein
MPLTEGYQATLRTFEASQQRVRPMRLAVTGAETMVVPAGSFETFVVNVEPLDGDEGGTMKLNVTRQAPHRVVKAETKLPLQMGGGKISTELKTLTEGVTVGG